MATTKRSLTPKSGTPKPATRKPAGAAAYTTMLLVRHGQTPTTGKVLPGRAKGLHLADEGRRQADIAAARIAELKRVDAIYSSPLERAKETAAPISRRAGSAHTDRPRPVRMRLR